MAARRSSGTVTTNHDEIRRWVESNGGCPARVKGTGRGKDPGVLRIDYPGFSGVESLEQMPWDKWFDAFDKSDLAMVYQPTSRSSKLVSRTTARAKTSTRATPRRATGAKRATAKRPSAKRGARKKAATKRGATSATASRVATKRTTAKRPATRTKRPATRATTTKRGGTKRAAGSPAKRATR